MAATRYDKYHEIKARFNSIATSCGGDPGHLIEKGTTIGYAPRTKETHCAACWARWRAENDAADFDEAQYASGYGGEFN